MEATNPFDQFDAAPAAAPPPQQSANPFDQFDSAQPVSTATDVMKSLGSNVAQGVASVPMILPNTLNAAAEGPQMLYRGLTGREHDNSPMWKPFFDSGDVIHGMGMDYQPKTVAGAAVAIPAQIAGSMLGSKGVQAGYNAAPRAVNAGKNMMAGATARSPETLQDTAATMKADAGKLYDQVNVNLNTDQATQLSASVDKALTSQKFIPALNPKTVAIVDDLKQAASSGPLSLSEVDQYRRLLSRVGASEDGVSAGNVRKAIDQFIDTLPDSGPLKPARAQYAQASRFGEVSDILAGAQGDPNKIKSALTRFVSKPENLRGFSDTEADALRNAASGGMGDNILKGLGRFGFSPKNVFMPIVGGGAASAVFGTPAAAGLTAAGTVARGARSLITAGKAENAMRAIEGNPIQYAPQAQVPTLPASAAGSAASMLMQKPEPAQQQNPPISAPDPSSPQPISAPPATDLFQRVIRQESGGRQSAISPKGAVGVAQIMPKTGPDAARAAGLPFDAFKLRTDPEYNAALGKAYLGKMQEKYGNDALALIAYNWGPGNTDMWLKSGADARKLPRETQNYIKNILGGS